MFYISNKQYQVNLLCTVASEQIISALGQAAQLEFMHIFPLVFAPGKCTIQNSNNNSSEFWIEPLSTYSRLLLTQTSWTKAVMH